MTKLAKRAYFDDEEPELETVDIYMVPGCHFCGDPSHERADCDIRPLKDWVT